METEGKKSHGLLIGIIMLIVGLAVGVGGSYYYFKSNSINSTTTNVTKNDTKSTTVASKLNVDGVYVKDMVGRYDYSFITSSTTAQQLYNKDETKVSDLDTNYLKATIVNDIRGSMISFSASDFKNSSIRLYGPDMAIDNQNLQYGCGNYIYNSSEGYYSYKEGSGCGGTSTINMVRKIVKAIKSSDEEKLSITIAMAIVDDNGKVYKDISEKEEVSGFTSDSFNIDKDYDKVNQYQYNFIYDATNNNYYLSNITKV